MRRIPAVTLLLLALLAAPRSGRAQSFPIFNGDPVDPSDGQPYEIVPGVPLILPQPNGRYNPPIADTSKIGDVDIVVRAGSPMIGPTIPAPALRRPRSSPAARA